MSNSIKLSPKYGVNATIPVCFFCGEAKNEIALLGKIGKKNEDIEAPTYMLLDYEPCDNCKKLIGDNILVIGVEQVSNQNDNKRLMIHDGLVPYGNWCAMTEEAVIRLFDLDGEVAADVKAHKRLLVDYRILLDLQEQYSKLYGDEEGKNNG